MSQLLEIITNFVLKKSAKFKIELGKIKKYYWHAVARRVHPISADFAPKPSIDGGKKVKTQLRLMPSLPPSVLDPLYSHLFFATDREGRMKHSILSQVQT